MFIVHVVRQFTPSVGGLEAVVGELSRHQARSGCAVRVVTLDRLFHSAPGSSIRLAPYEVIDGVEVVRLPYWGSRRYPIATRVLRYIRGADIVHVHGVDFFFDFLALTKPLHRRKLVLSTHGGFFHTRYAAWLKAIWFRTITTISMRAYAAVVAVSEADHERFGQVRRIGLCCIENGVNIGKLSDAGSPTPRKAMLCIGRLSTNKRLDQLVGFVAALRNTDPEWSLTIAGRPWDQSADDIRRLAARSQQQNAITVLEAPTDGQLRSLATQASIFVSASEYEGFGIAAVEGLSAGLYPVLSDIGAFRSLVSAAAVGTLVAFDEPVAVAAAFSRTWQAISPDYPNVRQTCIAASKAYEWAAVAVRYLALYKSIMGDRTRSILDVCVQMTNKRGAFSLLERLLTDRPGSIVAFANVNLLETARTDPATRAALRKFIMLNDGIGTDIASRMLYGSKFPENLNGTDFVPYFLSRLQRGARLFLLGAKPGIAERAALALSARFPQHQIVGVEHGYCDLHSPELVERIRSVRAEVLLVGLGNPTQELWLAEHFDATGCALGIAVGALIDFVAGEVSRAPAWMRAARLEWLYRLCLEPRRLSSRYLVRTPLFLANIFARWWSGARGAPPEALAEPNMPSRP